MKGKNIFAILLILLGIGFLLDSLEYMEFSYTIHQWWPLIIIALGIRHISRKDPPVFSGLIIIGLGVILQADNLDYLPGSFWDAFLPLVLVIIGLSILLSGRRFFNKQSNGSSENDFDINAVFSSQNKNINFKDFKKGSINVTFGGAEVDLTKSEISTEAAVLNLNTTFGGIELRVPQNWRLNFAGSPMFGGFEDKTSQTLQENSPTLYINYNVLFGGIEIKN